MSGAERYRLENGERCIDVRLNGIEQMFDNRDPAPFRERDLDPDLASYLLDAGEDLAGEERIRVVFWIDKPCPPAEIEQAVHMHFEEEIARLRRTRKRRRRTGQVALLLGIVLVIALLSLAQFVARTLPGTLGSGLREGLVIFSWVVLWRPVETLIYDWIPARHDRRIATKLLDAPIEVRGSGAPVDARTGEASARREREPEVVAQHGK